ncbi:MAG: arginine--tRNA ligase [Bacteroidales bacterium]|nr:MAG: arginine--tRNA ligase [Bacteroidales bacterium]
MDIHSILIETIIKGINSLYGQIVDKKILQLQKTRKEFEGDITLVVFPLLKMSGKNPEPTAKELGEFLLSNLSEVKKYNVVKGFLNLTISDSFYLQYLIFCNSQQNYGFKRSKEGYETYMIEYSSPNTNKPLHLGHIRNNLIGYSISNILKANGKRVIKTNIVNDRGIHICKSMLAWEKWSGGETPESSGKKGDHLVGDYYVKFDAEYKKQIKELMGKGKSEDDAVKNAPLIMEAQEMLRKWEAKDPRVMELWKKMNGWVYDGFDATYKRLGVDFDKIYYESDTFLVGRETVLEGLKKGIFHKKDDDSVWIDLSDDGLDEKILLRADGTSVYITQDIGTARMRQEDYKFDKHIYVVGNEQEYHFQVLALILNRLGFKWAKDLYHLSYGMVELPEGKMKSREGTVVDADDLIDEMTNIAREMSKELGKLEGLTGEEKEDVFRVIGLGALKYFILKVDPVKNMTFDPAESIDFNGNTGPFIQYTYARIRSVLRKAREGNINIPDKFNPSIKLESKEKSLLKFIYDFPVVVRDAGEDFNPAIIANFTYELVKEFNQFYHDFSILKAGDEELRNFRLVLSQMTAKIIKSASDLLGIELPERM